MDGTEYRYVEPGLIFLKYYNFDSFLDKHEELQAEEYSDIPFEKTTAKFSDQLYYQMRDSVEPDVVIRRNPEVMSYRERE